MKEFWDQRYSEHEFVYGKEPNRFFKAFIDSEQAGSIFLPAEGEGRNALYAARKGWQVFAADFSHIAREKALNRASEESLEIRYDVVDLIDWNSPNQFDSIALIYAHFPVLSRQKLHRKFIDHLKPGGKIILEAFSKDQIHYNSGGPRDISMLYSIDMLEMDFPDFRFEVLDKLVKEVNESEFHQGKASIIQMIGQKT